MANTWQDLLNQSNANTQGVAGQNDWYNSPELGKVQAIYQKTNGDENAPTLSALNRAKPGKEGWNQWITPDSNGGVKYTDYEQKNGIDPTLIAMLAAGAGLGALGAGIGGAALPATGPMDLGGLAGGVAGAGGPTGLGSAFGLGDATLGGTLATSAGLPYDASLDLPGGLDVGEGGLSSTGAQDLSQFAQGPGLEVDGIDQLANEAAKLTQQQQLAQSGYDFFPPDLPTIDLSSALPKLPTDLLKKAAASLLNQGATGQAAASGKTSQSGIGGTGGVAYSQAQNETPGMAQWQAAPQQNQTMAQAMQLGNPSQMPQVNANGYMPVTQGVQPNYQMMQLAKALQSQQKDA